MLPLYSRNSERALIQTVDDSRWCQREETPSTPISRSEQKDLNFLYEEWAHPYFVSIEEYARLMEVKPYTPTPQTLNSRSTP
jgi:hypothetical protein